MASPKKDDEPCEEVNVIDESDDYSDLPPLQCLRCSKMFTSGLLNGVYYQKECTCFEILNMVTEDHNAQLP
jgi:hypothetical protein